ncbi:MAG: Gfo/Idh/MocA family oxidoreductase, partial [Candidatus Brocadiia bacterium]|nr:Gfo/Idh/MocA family oxidoreductase [Candidatus Brocadiia bacterium]
MRVGVAGLGRGRMFVDIFNGIEGCRVTAICDTASRALAGFDGVAAHTSYDDFLAEGLDVVAVITPGPVHAEQSIRAMEAGAHVLCETPCVYAEAEARAVVAACDRTGRSFMLAEDYIWMGWAVRLKQMAAQGAFGEIVYAEGDYTHDCRDIMLLDDDGYVPYARRGERPGARKSWRATDLPPLLYTSHTLGPLLHIMEDRVVSATGLGSGSRTAPELGTIDLETGLFQTEKGAIVRLTNGFTVAHPYALFYNLVGTRGSAKLMRTGEDLFVWYSDREEMGGWEAAPDDWLARPDGENHVAVMVREFVESVQNNRPPPLDVHRSLDFVLPGIRAHESALQGGPRL